MRRPIVLEGCPGGVSWRGVLEGLQSVRCWGMLYYVTRNNDPALLVLASLAEGDKHGYAMMEDIERFSSIKLGPGTLYGAITRLEENGWIAPVPSKDRRQPYTLTALGRKSLESEIATLNDVLKTASKRLRHA